MIQNNQTQKKLFTTMRLRIMVHKNQTNKYYSQKWDPGKWNLQNWFTEMSHKIIH